MVFLKPNSVDRIIKTDILTIGGGGASTAAAVAAYERGTKVTLVSKGKVGRSGNTIMIGGGFGIDGESAYKVCGEKGVDVGFTKDALFKRTVQNSFYLSDQNIVQQFVSEAPKAVKRCLDWARNAKQIFKLNPPAPVWRTSGRSFGRTLMQAIKENPGIEVIEDVIVVDLLINNCTVVGALGVDVYTGDVILFEAKAVVLATGGYQPYSFKNTISDMTGDGIAMALRAGAKIADMEFLLFIPTILEPRNIRGSILPYLMTFAPSFKSVFKVVDCRGDEIVIPKEFDKIPKANKLNKLLYSYFWGKAIFKGIKEYGNCIFYDFSHCSDREIEDAFEGLKQEYSTWHKNGWYNKVNLEELKQIIMKDRRLKVGLGCEYSMGGVVVDEKMSAGIPGLFAAGEVTSGLFGAFRGGDGLTEMLAQGFRAGMSAAEYINGISNTDVDYTQIDSIIHRIMEPFNRNEGVSPYKVQRNIENAADRGFNFFRDEEGLQSTLKELERIKVEELPRMSLASKSRRYNFEWITSILVKNLITCNEAGTKAALMRKESRGCHMRTDYPEVNNEEWLVKIEAQMEGSQIELTTRKPIVTKMPLPEGKHKSILDYVLWTL